MTRVALLLAAVSLAVAPAAAGQPDVSRTIGKEPVYQSKAPKYGLLVFGPQGKDLVWVVLDGDTLYVDRNGNGDLTEPGKKIVAEKRPDRDPEEEGYAFDVGDVAVGGRTHKGLSVYCTPLKRYAGAALGKRDDVKAALAKDPKALAVRVGLDVDMPGIKGNGIGGRAVFLAGPVDLSGVFQLAATPAEAPVVWFGGPLEITFYSEVPSLRVGRSSELVLVVGSAGIGPGTFAMLGYESTIPKDVKPVVELRLPAPKAGEPLRKEAFELKDRC